MSLEVLQDKLQINLSRKVMDEKGVSYIDVPDSRLKRLLRRFGLVEGVVMGDMVKSWDVLSTINFLASNVTKNEPILDIGCYASEILASLKEMGYVNLTGADLNPGLNKMPYQDSIRYEITNFMHTKFEESSFQAITSISVIEHGFDGKLLLEEMSRILKPGGYFIASFDYWPEKIDTQGIKIFEMDWNIFSEGEIADFITEASNYGLFPAGNMRYEAKSRVINHGGKQYTFALMILKKTG